MTPPAAPRANLHWATLIVEELVRSGVGFFCVAPGSRSTPLVAALASNEKAESLIHFDERGTAFAAVGYARATGLPAAWITTSVRWRFDLPAPEETVDPAMVLTTIDQAVYRARRAPSGPVHLNLMFREPFLSDPDERPDALPAPARWQERHEPFTRYAATKPSVPGMRAGAGRGPAGLRERSAR